MNFKLLAKQHLEFLSLKGDCTSSSEPCKMQYCFKSYVAAHVLKYILKPSPNLSLYIFTLVQKVKHRVYKIHAFLIKQYLTKILQVISWRVLLARAKIEKRYLYFKMSHFFIRYKL